MISLRAALCVAASLASVASATADPVRDPLAPTARWSANTRGSAATPPMGWNTWNAFTSDIDEEKVLASAQALVDTGLARLGYRYVDIDDGWWLKRRQPDGRLVIRTDRFPSAATGRNGDTSFRPLTDRLHDMGLKAGIYSDIGANTCAQIYTSDFRNLPQGSVAEREVGLYGHVDQDMKLYFGEWNFDLIKVDGCGVRALPADAPRVKSGLYRAFPPLVDMDSPGYTNIAAMRDLYRQAGDAVDRHAKGRDYIFSLCLWGAADVRSWGKDVGNISRTSDDITPQWGRMLTNMDSVTHRALYAHPGSWNDPDMLFVGTGDFDANHLTEARAHFAMWAMLNAPLLIGYDLRKLTPELTAIFGNAALVALNQDAAGNQAVLAFDSDEVQIFAKTLADGGKAAALFNRTDWPMPVQLTADHLKLRPDAAVTLHDLSGGKDVRFTGETTLTLAPHEARVFRVEGTRRLADGLYLSEQTGRINPAIDGIVVPTPDPTIHHSIVSWTGTHGVGDYPQYLGWGGAEADRAPYGKILSVGRKTYDTGIGVLANSRLEMRNAGFRRFVAQVGVNDSGAPGSGAIVFELWGDGKLLKRSQPMAFGQAAVPLEADVAGAKIIELVVRGAAGDRPQPATWANAALLR